MLTVEGLSKRFGGFLAVNQVSFEVREGENSRPHRSKRLGQEHDLQSYCGKSAPDVGVGPPARQGNRRFAGLRHLPQRGRAHLPDSTALPQTFASRKRDARSLLRRRREYRARRSLRRAGEALDMVGLPSDATARTEGLALPRSRSSNLPVRSPPSRACSWPTRAWVVSTQQKWSALPNCSTISEPEWA